MRPLFGAVADDAELGREASDLATLMGTLQSRHELAHYFLHRDPALWRQLSDLFDGALAPVLERITADYGKAFAEEVLCDAFAAHVTLEDNEEPLSRYDRATRRRMIAFHALLFADLVSLSRSAQATADQVHKDEERIDLASEKRQREAFSYSQGRVADLDVRADTLINLLATDGEQHGEPLFGDNGGFPLSSKDTQLLKRAFERFGDEIPLRGGSLSGTDAQQRGLSQLIAESLKGHQDGVEFLLWRSKKFHVGGQAVDP